MNGGIVLINKAKGWTSFDVVAKVRSILKKETGNKVKVGHAGTLDPLAEGLMIILVGSYTKKASDFMKLDKVYEVEMKLGETSSTGDEEGEKIKVSTQRPSHDQVTVLTEQFVGTIDQIPHSFSAIKVGGQRAYKLARAGKEVKLEPRKVTIYSLDGLEYDYPSVKFVCKVSSGTYIRSLVEDIGSSLGTGAYMTSLKRTQIGNFTLQNAISIEEVTSKVILTYR